MFCASSGWVRASSRAASSLSAPWAGRSAEVRAAQRASRSDASAGEAGMAFTDRERSSARWLMPVVTSLALLSTRPSL